MIPRIKQMNISKTYQTIVWLAFASLIFLAGTYAILINNIILNLAERETSLRQMTRLESELAQTEAKYITLAKQITPELAQRLGYEDVTLNSAFVASTDVAPLLASTKDNDS